MKKIIILVNIALAFSPFIVNAQEILLPSVEVQAQQDKVPFKVKNAVLNDFGSNHQPFVWVTPQTIYNSSLWSQNVNVDNMEIYSYAIHSKTTAGDALDALYSADGKKISSREFYKNFRPSEKIMLALQNSEFKDWGIAQDYHLIKALSNGKEKERYELVMRKGDEKKFLYFDQNGELLSNKNIALAEAEW